MRGAPFFYALGLMMNANVMGSFAGMQNWG